MRRFARTFAAATAALALMAFAHTEPQYTVEFPEGWEVFAADSNNIVRASPIDEVAFKDGAFCSARFFENPASAKETQGDINTLIFAEPMTPKQWIEYLGFEYRGDGESAIEVTDVAVVEIGQYLMQIATISLKSGLHTTRTGITIVPGRTIDVTCSARPEKFKVYEPAFDAVVKSLRPV